LFLQLQQVVKLHWYKNPTSHFSGRAPSKSESDTGNYTWRLGWTISKYIYMTVDLYCVAARPFHLEREREKRERERERGRGEREREGS
jgi:hypothetical protein